MDEWRLEVVVPERLVAPVVAAMRTAHSYEEPAFDVYPLRPRSGGGEGRIGDLAKPATLGELAERTKRELIGRVGSGRRRLESNREESCSGVRRGG